MSEKVDAPAELPEDLEAVVQKVAQHTGYTRDEVIEKMVTLICDMADDSSDASERPAFLATIRRALQDEPPQA